ncbi:MAG: S9 family peptidase [Saprospiraceae bacterium]|nr:S9 family peptidase [Saprospiraceae bacterium]
MIQRILILIMILYSQDYIYGQSDFPYQQPHADIMALADSKPAPSIRLNYTSTKAVLMFRNNFKSIEELCEDELRLAGMRINPKTNIGSRLTYFTFLQVLDIASGIHKDVIGLPSNPKLSNFIWSDDHSKMGFTNTVANGVELWILDIKTNKAMRLTEAILNASFGTPFTWNKDGRSLLITVVPSDRKQLYDVKNTIPTGPVISENDGQKAQNRTYQDLLQNPYDEFNFEQLTRSEIKKVDLSGKLSPFLPADMYRGISFSPDGEYLIISTVKKPFSYLVPVSRFPSDMKIYKKDGKFVKTIVEIPLTEELPKGFMAVRKGQRNLMWRSDKAATLVWVEALDEGDPAVEVEYRDEVYQLNAPFDGKPSFLAKTKERFAGISWCNDNFAVLTESWWNTRNIRTLFMNPANPSEEPKLFNQRNSQDKYADPGFFATERTALGTYVISLEKNKIFLIGDGYSNDGKFPFIDKYDIESFEKERIYESVEKEYLEDISSAVDVRQGLYLTRLESKNVYPNYFIRNIHNNSLKQITNNENPFKIIDDVYKEVITYKREDGLELSATLYLPVGYDRTQKEKLPMIMWAYPTEFKDKSSASQVTANANEFIFPGYGSPIYWLNRGYVVLDRTAFPIVGEGEDEPNDTYIPQLVANAKAAIDAVDRLGYIDRNKIAVGGHSYGAFMTANLLTHSDLFAAGIARSGAYNRTLTPFGFQSEERNYWEAPEVYNAMSPFMNADKMKTPLLLIHGEADNNSGTFPMQSERYFNALKGLGAVCRLVILPKESHGYAARESILHMLWEQDQWLDKYVKNRKMDVQP